MSPEKNGYGNPEHDKGLWDRAIAEVEKKFELQELMDELERPTTLLSRKQEIHRVLGCILLLIAVPVGTVVLIKKIAQRLNWKNKDR